MDIISVFETEVVGSTPAGPANKEIIMKIFKFKNRLNGEIVICENIKDTHFIDGIEYLLVRKIDNDRRFLMRKEALEKV